MPEGPLNGRPIGVQIKLRNPNPAAGPLSEAEQAELAIVKRLEKCNTDRLDPSASQPEVMVKRTRCALTRGSTDGRKALCPRAGSTCLDVRVSKQSLDRVLGILDHVMTILRAEDSRWWYLGMFVNPPVSGSSTKTSGLAFSKKFAPSLLLARRQNPRSNLHRSSIVWPWNMNRAVSGIFRSGMTAKTSEPGRRKIPETRTDALQVCRRVGAYCASGKA